MRLAETIFVVLLLTRLAPLSFADNASETLSIIVMADIGHAREYRDQLTTPWPMNKCAFEGAFSLYEGLYDYVTRQGAQPSAALVLGDVAYSGGNSAANENTRSALQKYLAGKVPDDRVFVAIGNHDVHYLGCTDVNVGRCNFGSERDIEVHSKWNMSFDQWRSNWIKSFPGLTTSSSIAPPNAFGRKRHSWLPPLRYNLNLDQASSVYIIAGLNSGAAELSWNGDTPLSSTDAKLTPGLECDFLRDSIAHGRSLGKTIFIYFTHHFNDACRDWSLISQIDVWMYGHKHNFWQSALSNGTILQEQRHYPARLLIGNGGFDEAHIDVVSFGHVKEEILPGQDRVRLTFDVFDTCISDEASCPDSSISLEAACWLKCKDFPGGFDNGGGPRKATPSKHAFGFQLEAPRKQGKKQEPQAPYSGSWKIQVQNASEGQVWLVTGACPWGSSWASTKCIRSTRFESEATTFSFYDARRDSKDKVSARVAVDDYVRAPLMYDPSSSESHDLLYRPGSGFWAFDQTGAGQMYPSKGHMFEFQYQPAELKQTWRLLNVSWQSARGAILYSDALSIKPGSFLDVEFQPASRKPEIFTV